VSHGAEFIPTLEAFRLRRRETGERPQGVGPRGDSGHWNAYGHAWAAEILAERLAPMIRADRPALDSARSGAKTHASAPDTAEANATATVSDGLARKHDVAADSGN